MLPTGLVTFLFTDIEGSTRLFQKDHAAMDAALIGHHEILQDAIERHGGRVFQIVGDAFCAAFEDTAGALAAAIDAQRALHARTWPNIGPLAVRMGIHTGEIAMRDGTYASSLTLVKVQRVMSAGHGGQTLLSREAAERVHDDLPVGLALREMGAHRLRGLAEPIPLFQVVSPDLPVEFPPLKSTTADPANPAALLELLQSGVLVGRLRELEELREHLAVAMGSRGHLVLVSGEPGVGKTRLAHALMDEARVAGAVTLSGGSYEYEATTPYLPFVEAIRQWIHLQSPERLRVALGPTTAEIARFAPEVDEKLGAMERNAPLPPNEERLRLFDNVARFLERVANPHGLVVFLDDLHWADDSTLALLHYVLRHLRSAPVLFIGAYREVELDRRHPLAAALVEWQHERLTTRIQLARLTHDDTSALLAALFGEQTVSDDLINLLFRETEGNPFFVQESVKALIEQGGIYRDNDRWQRKQLTELAVPQSVKEAVGRRLNRLSDETTAILHSAAALGKLFRYDELAAVVDVTDDALLDALDEAVAAELLSATPHDGFAFTHDKIREVLYDELNPIRRRRLHQRIGEAMIAMYADRSDEHAQDIAYHFSQSGDLEQLVHFARTAAESAAAVYAFDEAQRHLAEAGDAADSLGETAVRLELLIRSAELYSTQGRAHEAGERYEEAIDIAPEPSRGALRIRAGAAYCMSGESRGRALVERGLEEIPPEADRVIHAIGLTSLGRYHHYEGRARDAIRVLERAYEIVRQHDDPETLTGIFSFLAGAYQHLTEHDGSDRWADELISLGERLHHPHATAVGYEYLAENALMTGRFNDSLIHARRDRSIGEEHGMLDRIAWSSFIISQDLHALGELADALQSVREAHAVASRLGEQRLLVWVASAIAEIEADRGEFEAARGHAHEGVTRSRELDQTALAIWSLNAEGYVLLRAGDPEQALERFEEALERVDRTGVRIARGFAYWNAVEALVRLGRFDDARARIERKGTQGDSLDRQENLAVSFSRGMLLLAEGRPDEALRELQPVVTEAETAGLMLLLARALLLRAKALFALGRDEEAEQARRRSTTLLEERGAVSGIG